MLKTLRQSVYLMTYTPIHSLNLCTGLQVDNAVREEVEHLFADLLRIMPVLQHIAGREIIPDIIQVFHQLVGILIGLKLLWHLWK